MPITVVHSLAKSLFASPDISPSFVPKRVCATSIAFLLTGSAIEWLANSSVNSFIGPGFSQGAAGMSPLCSFERYNNVTINKMKDSLVG
jgi:hypothetical protein